MGSRLAVAVLTASLGLATVAWADRTSRRDARNDIEGAPSGEGFDFARAVAYHAERKLVHKFVSHYPDFARGAFVRVLIDTRGRSTPEFIVEYIPEDRKAAVYRYRDHDRVGRATKTNPDSKTVRFSFRASAIGSPSSYRWWARIEGRGENTLDRIPDRGSIEHELRSD
jgi:hypothetical protein